MIKMAVSTYLGTLLAACCIFLSVNYASAAPAKTPTVKIVHAISERYIRGVTSPAILEANGATGGKLGMHGVCIMLNIPIQICDYSRNLY